MNGKARAHLEGLKEARALKRNLKKANTRIVLLRTALEKAQGDINWMLNERKFLNPDVFNYLDDETLPR